MEFYYPNFINDMWRICGLIFFDDKEHFIENKRFDKEKIVEFCSKKGIAMFDTATEIIRLKDNASDKFLEVVRSTDIEELLSAIPECKAIVTTGQKAMETLVTKYSGKEPKIGEYTEIKIGGRILRLYRLPSTSRAYPLALEKKAEYYKKMYSDLDML